MSLLLFVSSVGATGFITRLITQDDITDWLRNGWRTAWILLLGPRHKLIRPPSGSRKGGKLWNFIACHYCVGFWVAIFVFWLAWRSCEADWFVWPALALTAAFLISLLLELVKR